MRSIVSRELTWGEITTKGRTISSEQHTDHDVDVSPSFTSPLAKNEAADVTPNPSFGGGTKGKSLLEDVAKSTIPCKSEEGGRS